MKKRRASAWLLLIVNTITLLKRIKKENNMTMEKVSHVSIPLCVLILLITHSISLTAAPHNGDIFHFSQPDGSQVTVKIWGDEHYQTAEGIDGYSLVQDPSTRWICYATLSSDRREYISTGVHYTLYSMEPGFTEEPSPGEEEYPPAPGIEPHLRITQDAIRQKAEDVYVRLHEEPLPVNTSSRDISRAITDTEKTGTVTGLTLLVDFPDVSSSIPREEIVNLINQEGYAGYDNNGSVKDYYYDISGGKLIYENQVSSFITMNNNKSYYDSGDDYANARVLLYEALDTLQSLGFDFSQISVKDGEFIAINLMYAGTPDAGWGKGLWPHKGTVNGSYTINNIKVRGYQMSNIGTDLNVGTFCHENGHLICGWPDLYAYDSHDYGIGYYCIMSYNDKKNPQTPNPYFRYLAGWISFTEIAGEQAGTQITAPANSGTIFRYHTGGEEYFLIEARTRTGRSGGLPDEGLLIWHVNTSGDNRYEQYPNLVAVEQADGLNELENKQNRGGPGDLFHAGDNDWFNDSTTPDARYISGAESGLDVSSISETGATMSFVLGGNPQTTPETTPAPTPTGGSQTGEIILQYRCGDTNPTTNQIKPHINIINSGDSDLTMDQLTLRYYYTREGSADEEFHVDYAQAGTGNISGNFYDNYLEVHFSSGAGNLSAGTQTGEIQLRFNKTDWSGYDQSDDYSFDPSFTGFQDYTYITLYCDGALIWGTEPGGTAVTQEPSIEPSAAPSPEPTEVPTPAATGEPTESPPPEPTPEIITGDVNNDGAIDILDALVVAQVYVGIEPAVFYSQAADVNCDDVIDILDALVIAQFYVGLIDEFCTES
jgi:M6 family metalloprotease-like protein